MLNRGKYLRMEELLSSKALSVPHIIIAAAAAQSTCDSHRTGNANCFRCRAKKLRLPKYVSRYFNCCRIMVPLPLCVTVPIQSPCRIRLPSRIVSAHSARQVGIESATTTASYNRLSRTRAEIPVFQQDHGSPHRRSCKHAQPAASSAPLRVK